MSRFQDLQIYLNNSNEMLLPVEVVPGVDFYGHKVYVPVGTDYRFYVWDKNAPVFESISLGPDCIRYLQQSLPIAVNIFFTLTMITAVGRIGVCIRQSELERLSYMSLRKSMNYIIRLRRRWLVTWGFTNESNFPMELGPSRRNITPIKIYWVNRDKVLR